MKPILLVLVLSAVTLIASHAGEGPKLTISKRGAEVAADDFSGDGLGKQWTVAKGKWEVKDGVLLGSELESDEHAGVLNLQKPNHNLILQFDFELRGAKGFALSFNHSKGHLWRVSINENGAQLRKDSDKKNPASKAVLIADAKAVLEKGRRYLLTAEIVGEKVVVRIGESISLTGSDADFDIDKPNIRLVVQGESVAIDNVKVWEALPAD